MKRIVLLVEDKPEEMSKAREILKNLGWSVAVAMTLEDANRVWTSLGDKLVGVITDLHFPHENEHWGASHPAGLALVTRALLEKKPVVVCTGGAANHGVNAPFLVELFSNLAKLSHAFPIYWNKEWQTASEELGALIKGD